MSVQSGAESFTYGSSMHGGRPTFALTRRLGKDTGLTLYELIPENLANGRQKRLQRANSTQSLNRISLPNAIPNARMDSVDKIDFTEVWAPPDHSPANWSWNDWHALKVTTLRGKRQQAVHRLVVTVLDSAGIEPASVTRGEGSAMLSEASGVRLTIAFLAIKNLQKYDKITTVADSIARMSSEECYYWHSKCRSPSNPNGIKALRVLLADHI